MKFVSHSKIVCSFNCMLCSLQYMGILQNKYDVENDNKDENEDEDKVHDKEIFEH